MIGVVAVDLPQPAEVRRLWVELAGREVVGGVAHYAPAVYLEPVPRPWGRSRTGSARHLYRRREALLGVAPEPGQLADSGAATQRLEPGRHLFAFHLEIPANALPTYGGATVLLEHELLATLELNQGKQVVWQPLHVWRSEPAPAAPRPAVLTARAQASGWYERLFNPLRLPIELFVELPDSQLDVRGPLLAKIDLRNPHQVALRHLVLELVGVETSRHLAATDVHEFLVARKVIPVPDDRRWRDELRWHLPPRLAPSLDGPRFKLEWRLDAMVTAAFSLGVRGSVEVLCHDAANDLSEDHERTEKENAPRGEPASRPE